MAVTTEVGSYSKSNGAAPATDTITLAAEPKAMIFFWGNINTLDTRAIFTICGIGFTDFTNERCSLIGIENASDPSDTYKRFMTDKTLAIIDPSNGNLIAQADVTKSSNVVTVTWTLNDGSLRKIKYMAIYGDDITNVKVGSITATTGSGSLSTTDPGFQPDFVMFHSTFQTTAATSEAHAQLTLGWAASSAEQAATAWLNRDALATVDLRSYQRTDSCLLEILNDGSGEEKRYDFTSFDATGFTLNKTTSVTATEIHYLAIKGGDWTSFAFDKDTDTGEQLVAVDLDGGTPKGAFFASGMNAASTSILSEDSGLVLGASDGTNDSSIYIADDDAGAAIVVRGATSAQYALMGGNFGALNAQATVQSFGADTIDLEWAANTTPADQYIGWAVADTPVVGGAVVKDIIGTGVIPFAR